MPSTIRVDPFFDGEGPQSRETRLPEYDVAQALPAGYRDVRDEQLGDGRPALAVMRAGPSGLTGTVIPPATPGGVPRGVRPHVTQDLFVNIDPHIRGQEARVRLGDINAQTLAVAEETARQLTPDPYDMPTQRLRASAVLQGVAVGQAEQYAPQLAAPVTAPQVPGNIPAPALAQFSGTQPPQRAAASHVAHPLQAFAERPAQPPVRPVTTAQSTQPPEFGPQRVLPPQHLITFEIEHFGIHRARYHDVLSIQGFLVLIYDSAYQGGEGMYVPPSGDDAPPMALHVEGSNEVHLVHTTGIVYSYGGHEFCVLLVERSVPAEAMEA